MTSNDKRILEQIDFYTGLNQLNQQCNRTKAIDQVEERKDPRFAFSKISASVHCTHLKSRTSQRSTQALQKSAILPPRNNEHLLVKGSIQYFRHENKTQMEDISLDDLSEKEWLTARSVNLCENAGLTSLRKILKYFQTNGTFTLIRNCGAKSNRELITLCEKYQSLIAINDPIETIEINRALTIFNELSPLKKSIINRHIEYLTSTLTVRGHNGIKSISDSIVPKIIIDRIFDPSFDFKDIRNIGEKTVDELNLFKQDLLNFIQDLKEFNEDELTREYTKLIIRTNFADLSENFEERFEVVFDENGKLKLFKLIDLLIETEQLFNKNEKQLFLFSYSSSDHYTTLETIASKLELTRERVRQIKVHLIKDLPTYLQFISNFKPADFVNYEIETAPSFVVVDNVLADKLNQQEGVNFNPLFYSLVFGIVYKNLYSVLGDDEAIIGKNKLSKRNRYKYCYLISNRLFERFDFEAFVKDVYSRSSDRITESYSLHFEGYLCQYLQNVEYKISTALTEACEAIIYNEFDVVVDHDRYLKFERNTKKQAHEYALEVLNDKGKLMTVDEIAEAIKLKYPEFDVNPSSIRSSMIREKELFLYIGRSSTYGLRKWESEQENLKGGTIRDIVEEFLTKESVPKHISEILNHVSQYRESNEKNVLTNIKADESNRFIFYAGNFVGLKNKSYPVSDTDFKRIVGSLFSKRVLKKYDGWRLNDFINHYVEEYGYQPVQIKHIINKRINENQIILTSDNRLSL